MDSESNTWNKILESVPNELKKELKNLYSSAIEDMAIISDRHVSYKQFDHYDADMVLLDFLSELGLSELIEMYLSIEKKFS